MAIPTEQQLIDAERDLNDLETIVNGDTSALVATRTGGNKPSVAKIVNDALAAEILGGGAGVVTRIPYRQMVKDETDVPICTLPQLDPGLYRFNCYMVAAHDIQSSSGNRVASVRLHMRVPQGEVGSLGSWRVRVLKRHNNQSTEQLIFSPYEYYFSIDLFADLIDMTNSVNSTSFYILEISGLLRLIDSGTPVFCSTMLDQSGTTNNGPKIMDGSFEITRVA